MTRKTEPIHSEEETDWQDDGCGYDGEDAADYQSLREHAERLTADLNQLRLDEATLASILFGDDHTAGKGFREMAAAMRTALAHLDAIIAAYQNHDGLGPMLLAIRAAKEWRGVKTSQDALGAIQSP